MKFSLSNSDKKLAYTQVKNELEKSLILRLTVLGIDPEKFDDTAFIPDQNSTAQKDIYDIILKIKEIDKKIEQL